MSNGPEKPQLTALLELLRSAVTEAFSKEYNPEKAEERRELTNAIQGIFEKAEPNEHGIVEIDFEDFHKLNKHTDVIRDAADIQQRFMGNVGLAMNLRSVADAIDKMQQQQWYPSADQDHVLGANLELDEDAEITVGTAAQPA